MAFWTDSQLANPKQNHRWKVRFGAAELQNAEYLAKSVTKPTLTQTAAEHVYLNYKYYFPGMAEWEPVTVTMVDTGEPDIAYAVAKLIEMSGYQIPAGPNSNVTMEKSRAINALSNFSITQFDSNGNDLETWRLRNAWLMSFTPSNLEYGNTDLSTYEMVIRYDWAELEGREAEAARIFSPK